MKGESIGELEELVLLTIGSLRAECYAIVILKEIQQHARRTLDVTAIHSVLRRLEKKGYVQSKMGGATSERGGRRKRLFSLTTIGRSALEQSMQLRITLYNRMLGVS